MTEQSIVPSNIRSDLVDVAIGFLKNSKVANEPMHKKREFLIKKGLTDNEIEYAFKIIPQKAESTKEIVATHQPSFLRRVLYDLIVAGLLGLGLKLIKRWFQSKRSLQFNEVQETIRDLQKTVQDMQTSITRLEQATDQFKTTASSTIVNGSSSSSSIEEIKREIQSLKALQLGRSQFPPLPQIPPSIPSWQIEAAQKSKTRLSSGTDENNAKKTSDDNKEDGDSIIVVSENEKKSDDENRLSLSPSSDSSTEA